MNIIKFVLKILVITIILSIVFRFSLFILSLFIGGSTSIIIACAISVLVLFKLDGRLKVSK